MQDCYAWGQYEAYMGQPRIAPPTWSKAEKLAWYAGYDYENKVAA